jgi:Domain of unknown function (DUF4105)
MHPLFSTVHPLTRAMLSMAFIGLLGALAPLSDPPRALRDWYPYLARVAHVEMSEAGFGVAPVSKWSYSKTGPTAQDYGSAAFAFAELRDVWFVLEPQPGSQLAAHTLLLFEFAGDRLLGITIEARREAHEEYSAISGAFNAFELSYLWASARDLLTRRAVMLDHEVFVYPVAIDDEQKRALLSNLLERTDQLEQRPRHYNTLFSNCTNELAKAAGLDWALEFILTGRSDEYLFARGIIPGDSFVDAHARSDMTDFVTLLNDAPRAGFDAALLAELRRRNPALLTRRE